MKKIIGAILLFFLAVYLFMASYFSDAHFNKYSDRETVKENQAIEKGWVPAILPESAYDIAETHDLDTNELFGNFQYKEKDEEALLKNMTASSDKNDTLEWGDFLFKIDREKNRVKYRNKPTIH
jgi:hypothetical protein